MSERLKFSRVRIVASADAEYTLRSTGRVACKAAKRAGGKCGVSDRCSIGRNGKGGMSLTPKIERVNGINVFAVASLQERALREYADETAFLEQRELKPVDDAGGPIECKEQIYTNIEASVSPVQD